MAGWLKALLIVVVIVVVLVVGVVIAGIFWVAHNKDSWIARGKEVMTEGRDFGRGTDNQGCVDESISRYQKAPGISSTISNSIFMRGCLESSRATAGFCDDVPRQTEFIKSAQWRISQCTHFKLEKDSNCQNLFTPVQQFCEAKTK
jgi:hypothetical protein